MCEICQSICDEIQDIFGHYGYLYAGEFQRFLRGAKSAELGFTCPVHNADACPV